MATQRQRGRAMLLAQVDKSREPTIELDPTVKPSESQVVNT